MVHDPRRQTTRPTTAGGKRVASRSQPAGFGFTPRELAGRAQSLGLSIEDFLSLSQREREQGASAIGAGIVARLGRGGSSGDDDDFPDIGVFGGDGGGGGGGSFLGSQAGQAAANAFLAAEAQKDRDFQLAEADKARKFERDREIERLKGERERIFTDMLGTDPVRAVLFALGVGGEILPGGDRFSDLKPLKGARAQAANTEEALGQLLGRNVGVGQEGVTGLGTASQAAAAFGGQAGGAGGNVADQQKLLLSGFGVGAKRGKGRPGQSREETLRQIQQVTPQGVL